MQRAAAANSARGPPEARIASPTSTAVEPVTMNGMIRS
jgi:hypothetical protein